MAKRIRVEPPALEWLDGAFKGRILLYVCGSNRVLIENHLGVIEFSPRRVRLAGAHGQLLIEGEALTICEARDCALIVRGQLHNIHLPQACDGDQIDGEAHAL